MASWRLRKRRRLFRTRCSLTASGRPPPVGGRADLCRPGPPVVVGHAQVGPPARDLGRLRGGRDAETWLGVLEGLDCFEGRSSLRTYVFTILVNRAKTKGVRNTGPSRCRPRRPRTARSGRWWIRTVFRARTGPTRVTGRPRDNRLDRHQPENRVVARETMSLVEQALEGAARAPTDRGDPSDVQGLSSDEACGILNLDGGEPADAAAPGSVRTACCVGGLLPCLTWCWSSKGGLWLAGR